MRKFAVLTTAAVMALSAAACGSSSKPNATGTTTTIAGSNPAKYGTFTPATAGQFSVQVSLPAPGWWNGNDPGSLTGGFEFEMAKEIGKRLGLAKTVVKNVNFDALVAAQTGDASKFDLALSEVTITDKRAKVVDFTVPYFSADQGIMVNKGKTVTEADLKNLKWGVQSATTGEEFVRTKIKPNHAVKSFQDLATLFTALQTGQVEAMLMDTVIELPQAGKQDADVVGQFKTGELYGGILPKGSPNLTAINNVIKEMDADGTLKQLAATWLQPEFKGDPTKVPYLQTPTG